MPGTWQDKARNILRHVRDLALAVLVIGGAQIALSLIPWLALLRSQPLGFSMALSIVGFGGWFLGFATSIGVRRASPGRVSVRQPSPDAQSPAEAPRMPRSLIDEFRDRIGRAGCGLVLFLSSLLPLALAFGLRLQADLQSGKTWSDIFSTLP